MDGCRQGSAVGCVEEGCLKLERQELYGEVEKVTDGHIGREEKERRSGSGIQSHFWQRQCLHQVQYKLN